MAIEPRDPPANDLQLCPEIHLTDVRGNEGSIKEGRAGSPSRPFLRAEPMSREKKAA